MPVPAASPLSPGLPVLVVGRGRSAAAAARLVAARGGEPLIADDTAGDSELATGEQDFPATARALTVEQAHRELARVGLVVPSPGVAAEHGLLRAALAAGKPVLSEIELAARHIQVPLYAVTGTNGKSTTVSLLAAAMRESGMKVFAGGNLGQPLCDAVGGDYHACVVEVSSFQLEWVEQFAPFAAALLNIAPDHLDRHGSMASYLAAKLRIFANMKTGSAVLGDQFLDRADGFARKGLRIVAFGVPSGRDAKRVASTSAAVIERVIADPLRRCVRTPDWEATLAPSWPVAPHDFENVAAAAALARAAGVSAGAFAAAVARFEPLPHRLVLVGEHCGLRFWNDSKATNPAAAVRSVATFPPATVVLLAGGKAKGGDLDELAVLASQLKGVVAYGEARALVARALATCARVESAAGMRAACDIALSLADPGDNVLLAPGCASFDEFADYAARGEAFVGWVEELGGKSKAS